MSVALLVMFNLGITPLPVAIMLTGAAALLLIFDPLKLSTKLPPVSGADFKFVVVTDVNSLLVHCPNTLAPEPTGAEGNQVWCDCTTNEAEFLSLSCVPFDPPPR